MILVRSFARDTADVKGSSPGLTRDDIDGMPFRLTYGSVPAGTSAESGNGAAAEVLYVFSGTGTLLRESGEAVALSPGTAVHTAALTGHTLTAGPDSPLDYACARWDGDPDPATGPDPATAPVRTLSDRYMSWSYEMFLQHLYDAADIPDLPFGSVFGEVPAHTDSKLHCHQDGEIFLILEGTADIVVEQESRRVGAGDLVHLPAFHFHRIRNGSDAPLKLASMYWEDIAQAVTELGARHPRRYVPAETLVFCPPPTPNGGVHIGHLAGPYVRADMYVRALRTLGRSARLITGLDDNQSHVSVVARRTGADPAELAVTTGDRIIATLARAGVGFDRVYRPLKEAGHQPVIRERFTALASAPGVVRETVETPWCAGCDHSLQQCFAAGECPSCGEATDGEICEACGRPNHARELVGLVCGLCGTPPAFRRESALLLDLDHHAPALREYLARLEGSGQLRELAARLIEEGLGRYRLTRTSGWGLPLDASGLPGQVVDPWVELALTQLEETERGAADLSATGLVTFLGYDNSYFYAILMSAIALATGRAAALPKGYVSNRFLHLDGAKFSTSRGHAVWADDLLPGGGSADPLRLGVLRRCPEEAVVDVTGDELAGLLDDPLLGPVREWLAGFAGLPGGGTVPGTGAWSPAHREFYRLVNLTTQQLDRLLIVDAFSSVAYVEALESLVRDALRFRAAERAKRGLASAREESRTSVALEYLAAKAFAALVHPVMPSLGAALWAGLGLPGEPRREADWTFIPSGHTTRLTVPPALWARPIGDGARR
ncbi:class I tRNA ligase family protein [Streptomyces sp. CAU 1734]|uniref:class I tRNA ligase family protein n=1 Tax=Streptomyces sp. CAU 1734 TaxID=3140360 RepID=UPI0032601957